MKKILRFVFLSLMALVLISCGKKELTTDTQAQDALRAAYKNMSGKKGGLMDATFDVAATIEGAPMVFDGTMALGYTIEPEFSAEMDITLNTELMGMRMSFPFKGYYEVADNQAVLYFNTMNTWMKSALPSSQLDLASMTELISVMMGAIDEVVLKGKTEINETPVYELEVKVDNNWFSKGVDSSQNGLSESDRQAMGEMLNKPALSVEELDVLLAGLNFPVYLRQSDLSLYGFSVDFEQCLGQLMDNIAQIDGAEVPTEVANLGLTGFVTVVYRAGEPASVYLVPQEARDTAIDMNATEEMGFVE